MARQASDVEVQNEALDAAPVLRRAARVREEEVHRLADQLLLEGQRPSVERLRTALGRGSPNTIAAFLDRWWSQLGARLRDLPGQELPGLPSEVVSAMLALWTRSVDHARTLLHETLAQQSAQLTAQTEQLERDRLALHRSRDEMQREQVLREQTLLLAQAQLREANERERLDQLKLEDAKAEQLRSQQRTQALGEQITALNEKLERAAQRHQADVRALADRHESTERHWLKELDEARQLLASERKQLATAERQHAAQAAEQQSALREVRQQLSASGAELKHAQQALIDARAQITKLERAGAELGSRTDRTLQVLEQAQARDARRIEELQQRILESENRGRSG